MKERGSVLWCFSHPFLFFKWFKWSVTFVGKPSKTNQWIWIFGANLKKIWHECILSWTNKDHNLYIIIDYRHLNISQNEWISFSVYSFQNCFTCSPNQYSIAQLKLWDNTQNFLTTLLKLQLSIEIMRPKTLERSRNFFEHRIVLIKNIFRVKQILFTNFFPYVKWTVAILLFR